MADPHTTPDAAARTPATGLRAATAVRHGRPPRLTQPAVTFRLLALLHGTKPRIVAEMTQMTKEES